MGDPVLTGRLEFVSLSALLQLVDSEAVSGTLAIGNTVEIGFDEGRPVIASFGTFSGRTALLESFLLTRGRFALTVADGVEGIPLGDCLELVMTGCRLSDEWRRIGPMSLDQAGPVEAPALAALLPHLPRATVRGAVSRAGLARAAVIDPLLGEIEARRLRSVVRPGAEDVVDDGDPGDLEEEISAVAAPPVRLVEAAPRPRPVLVTNGSSSWRELVELARQHARSREFDEAEALLDEAMRLAPGERVVVQNLTRIRILRSKHTAA